MEYGQSRLDFKKYTKQIWLAGLGAFSKAEEEGSKLFDSLVKTGSELEEKTGKITDDTIEELSEKTKKPVTEARDRIEKLIEFGVHQSLMKLGLVTKKDLQKLEKMVLELHEKMNIIMEENKKNKQNIQEK